MKVLFVASEATPLAKTGGLADVVASLPKELMRQGHDVRIIIPFYRQAARAARNIVTTGIKGTVECGTFSAQVELFATDIDGVPVYLLAHGDSFDRDHLYGTPAGDYPDNHRRFALFCRGVLSLLEQLDFCPRIIHCHDWQSALIPIILVHEPHRYPFLAGCAVVLTIHNLAYQGLFPPDALAEMGLSPALFTMEQLEFYGKANLLKGGILYSDSITTVSPTYREEILSPEQGCGLDGVLRGRQDDLHGILNGLDYEIWNPADDRTIVANYAQPEGKRTNKAELQRELGLAVNDAIPVFGMVSRLAAQKGLDLMARLLPTLAREPMQLVIVGTGDRKYLRILERFCRQGYANLSVTLEFAPMLASKVYAGSDIFLMPSHYEPCGLGQLIALRYGAVPLVRKTGGLADTVIDPSEDAAAATGFSFTAYTSAALKGTIDRALCAYGDKAGWQKMVRRGMAADFSWERSADRYAALYGETVARKGRI